MFKNPSSLALTTLGITALGWAVACSSSNNNNKPSSSSSANTSSGGSTSSGSNNSTSSGGGSGSSTSTAGGKNPLLIDDMAASTGSQLDMGSTVRAGLGANQSPGTWYTFTSDVDTSVTPHHNSPFTFTSVTPPSGVSSTHAACLTSAGFIGYDAGEGFNFAVTGGAAADAGADAAAPAATPTTFDASSYKGVTFWAMAIADAGAFPAIKIAFPDDQTHGAVTTSTCNMNLNATPPQAGQCDDDFADQTEALTGSWAQISISFATIAQGGYGGTAGTFMNWDSKHVYGLNFQVNGMAPDAGLNPAFGFCIADIQFTQ